MTPHHDPQKGIPVLRVARPTNDIQALIPFYVDGLGFSILGHFEDHHGFDGIMLGHPDFPYHLEFTHAHGHRVGSAPSRDHLLVFYLPDEPTWGRAVSRMRDAGFDTVGSFNPYWDNRGATFEDPDGYRVVLNQSLSPV